jgi:hypothetical protein
MLNIEDSENVQVPCILPSQAVKCQTPNQKDSFATISQQISSKILAKIDETA